VTECGLGLLGLGDNCCPEGCDNHTDLDCDATCGNHAIEDGESCDGNCPDTCEDDGNVCTSEALIGSPEACDVACTHPPVTTCVNADGCCPASCGIMTDTDCIPPPA
jgi:hypothetical protein